MGVNLDKPLNWKADIAKSVDMYNDWFVNFAPQTFRATRLKTVKHVERALLRATDNLKIIDPDIFVWLGRDEPVNKTEVHRAATIVA